jgi:hypothetical protein
MKSTSAGNLTSRILRRNSKLLPLPSTAIQSHILSVITESSSHMRDDDVFLVEHLEHWLNVLRIDPRRFVSKLLHVLNVGARIDSGRAVGAALAAQFQHT